MAANERDDGDGDGKKYLAAGHFLLDNRKDQPICRLPSASLVNVK